MNGFCAPNVKGPFSAGDLNVVRAGQFESAKLMDYHTQDNLRQLQDAGVTHFIQRLPELKVGQKWLEHAHNCTAVLDRMYPACKLYQAGNEPNQPEAWGDRGWEYQFYMRYVMRDIQTWCSDHGIVYGVDIEFILPPLSYAPALWRNLNLWKGALTQRPDHEQKIPALKEYMQYAGANCYWEYPKFMQNGSYGMSFSDVHNWAGLPVHVLEYGYSAYLLGTPYPALWRQMQIDYPAYIDAAESGGALSSHVFLVGGTADWSGLSLPIVVAEVIGSAFPNLSYMARAAHRKGGTP
jgi:hypothetical protein